MADEPVTLAPLVVQYDPVTGVPSEFNEYLPKDSDEHKRYAGRLIYWLSTWILFHTYATKEKQNNSIECFVKGRSHMLSTVTYSVGTGVSKRSSHRALPSTEGCGVAYQGVECLQSGKSMPRHLVVQIMHQAK